MENPKEMEAISGLSRVALRGESGRGETIARVSQKGKVICRISHEKKIIVIW